MDPIRVILPKRLSYGCRRDLIPTEHRHLDGSPPVPQPTRRLENPEFFIPPFRPILEPPQPIEVINLDDSGSQEPELIILDSSSSEEEEHIDESVAVQHEPEVQVDDVIREVVFRFSQLSQAQQSQR